MLPPSMCCPRSQDNPLEGGGCSLWSSYRSARNLIAFLLLSQVQMRFLCVWSPQASDVTMFQYQSNPFLGLRQVKSDSVFAGIHREI